MQKITRIGLCVVMSVMVHSVAAQRTNVEVKGVVVEEGTREPVEQATIRLLNVKDSTLINGMASGRNGAFAIKNVRPGTYLLSVSFVGYAPLYQPLQITGRTAVVDVGELLLSDATVQLGEAVVTGKAPEVVVRNDTIEYNADSYKVSEGSVLEDLLKKMPGVEIDAQGKITVNGKEIKKVMVDGKEFFSDDPKVASKNLPAEMVEKLQVLDRKSDMTLMTGFDDGDEETVINLVVKPGMKQGWFGNAFAGYGSQERYEGNAMVNRFYNNDQFTFMGGLNNTNNMGFSDLASTLFQGGGMMGRGGGFRFMSGNSSGGITASANAGFNFSKEFSKKLTITGNLRYSRSDNDAENKSFEQRLLRDDTTQYTNENDTSNRLDNNIAANFRLEWKPDTLTSIVFRPNFTYGNSRSWETDSYVTQQSADGVYRNDLDTLNKGDAAMNSNGDAYSADMRLEVSRKLNDKGRVLSGSLSGGYNRSTENGTNKSETDYYGTEEDLSVDQFYSYRNNGYNYRAYVSWVEPLGGNNFLQASYSFSQRRQEALKNTYDLLNGGALDSTYSKSYRNDFITQRAGLSFKAQREKYNYTLGINVDPSYSKSKNFIGSVFLPEVSPRNVINVSPMMQFNYAFDKQTNLRIDYNGRTTQPTMAQLQPVEDLSNPNNIVIGNPDLNPQYANNLTVRFQKFLPEQQTAMILMANGNYAVNDIVTDITNEAEGKRRTTYANIDGNYGANARFIINTPLKNRKFSVNSMSYASYDNSNSLVDSETSNNKNLTLTERAGIDLRTSLIDIGVNGNIRYANSRYSLQPDNNQNTFNYGAGGQTTLYLPASFKVESDINYSTNSGYSGGYEQSEIIWNASLSKSFLKGNQGTLRFKIYDILQQRSNISRSTTAYGYTDSEYNTLSSYFMLHFIYRFSIFKGGANASDMRRNGPRFGPPPDGASRF